MFAFARIHGQLNQINRLLYFLAALTIIKALVIAVVVAAVAVTTVAVVSSGF